ncbi:11579_t:CDS:2, partial [Diversispora eburnea]
MVDFMFTSSSLIASLLCIIPGIFHIQTRNWGAIFMTFWVLCTNLINFTNSLLWANDLEDKARIYCLISTPLYVGSSWGLLSSIACMIHTLYTYVANPIILSERVKKRQMIRDTIVSIILPVIGVGLNYLVQTNIYGIRPVLGCFAPAHKDWVFIFVNAIWPVIISGTGCYYAARTSYAIIKKRLEIKSLLRINESGLNTAKFYRLVFFCITFLLLSFPSSLLILFSNLTLSLQPYNFKQVHENFWKVEFFTGDNLGVSFFDYSKPLVGFFVFLFFGTGQDALATYARWARVCKLDLCFNCLKVKESNDNMSEYHSKQAKFDLTSGLKFKINGLNTITNDNSDYDDLDLNDDFYQKRDLNDTATF